MAADILTLLQTLYGADAAPQIERVLRQRMVDSALPPVTGDTGFSEGDAVLITYGDTLQHPGEKPLRTLHHFAVQHFADLISHIHLLPFFPYSSDDGFSVQDFYAVNPALGDWDDINRLGNDFGLMFDAVFNHMSAQSDWFRRFLAQETGYQNLFRTESPDSDLSGVTRPRATPLLTAFTRPDGSSVHAWTTFSADQVDFDLRDPHTLLRLLDILLFYVQQGATIIRLDAICYLWKEVGTSCIHLPRTHAAVQLMRSVLDTVAPHVMLITETNVPHAENVSYFGNGTDEAHMVYNFTLPPLVMHTLLSGDASRLRDWANTLATPSPTTTFFNFTASHDGIGVRPVEGILSTDELAAMIAHVTRQGGRVNYKRNSDGSESPYELNISYVDAVTDPDQSQTMQVRRFMVSQAIALALAGVPGIYVHSLLGSRSDISGMQQAGYNRAINRAKLNAATVTDALNTDGHFRADVFAAYRHLLTIRRTLAAFHPGGAQQALDVGSAAVFALRRTAPDGSQTVLALNNVSDQPQPVTLPDTAAYTDALTGQTHQGSVTLAPYQVAWLQS